MATLGAKEFLEPLTVLLETFKGRENCDVCAALFTVSVDE